MDKLLNLGLMVVSEMQAAERRRSAGPRTTTTSAICMAAAVVFIAGGLGCAVVAFWIYLAAAYGALTAAVGTAIALVVTGLILFAVSRSARQTPAAPAAGSSVAEDLLSDLTRAFQNNKGPALLAALIAGIVAGNQSK
jgi:hypothetical protein